MKNVRKILPYSAVLVVILLILFLLFTQPQDPSKLNQEKKESGEVYTPTLTVKSQNPSDSILVQSATLEKSGFIAAFKTMGNNMPDESNFAGVSSILEGTKQNIQVPLTEPAKEGDTYTVIVHVDDGDKIFEFPGDDQPSSFPDGSVNYVTTTIATPSAQSNPEK